MPLVSFGSTNNALPTPVSLSKASACYASMHYWQYPLAIFSQCITYSRNQREKNFFLPLKALFQVSVRMPRSEWVILVNMVISVILGHEKTKIQNIIDLGKIDVFSVKTIIHNNNKKMGHLI